MHEQPTLTSCSVCGGKLASNASSCPHCGAPTDNNEVVPSASQAPAACRNCNAPLEAGAKFCTACGTPTGISATGLAPTTQDHRYQSLYCSADDKQIFGLCGGVAHKMNMDPAAVRIITCLVILFTAFVPFVIYCVLGATLPKLPTTDIPSPNS
tara:strand:- start:252 stop:713 length:462 start_codon:yes stop_codon:yes gene_type:complete